MIFQLKSISSDSETASIEAHITILTVWRTIQQIKMSLVEVNLTILHISAAKVNNNHCRCSGHSLLATVEKGS
jgi:hypothetical protein